MVAASDEECLAGGSGPVPCARRVEHTLSCVSSSCSRSHTHVAAPAGRTQYPRRVLPLCAVMRIITVGEGDCSYSLALARAFGPAVHVTCTTFISEEECVATYARAGAVIAELRELGHTVCDGIDATALASCTPPLEPPYDHVCFLHPHLGLDDILDEAAHARRHSVLVAHYLAAAATILAPGGCIHLTLCGNQPRTWEVHTHAARLGLDVLHEKDTVSSSCFFPADGPVAPLALLPANTAWGARRKFRSGALGSRHWAGKYGYEHRRCEGDEDMNVDNSIELVFSMPSAPTVRRQITADDFAADALPAATTSAAVALVSGALPSVDSRRVSVRRDGCRCCPICGVALADANGDTDEDDAAHVRRLATPSCTVAGAALQLATERAAVAMPVSGSSAASSIAASGPWRCEVTGRVFRSEGQYRSYRKQQLHEPEKPRKMVEAAAAAAAAAEAASRAAAASAAAALANPNAGAVSADPVAAEPASDAAAASTAASCSHTSMRRISHRVPPEGEGQRVASWARRGAFASKLRSKKQAQQAFKEGRVLLGGCPVEETRCLHEGDVLELMHDPQAAVRSQAAGSTNAPVVLLHVEAELAFASKPAGQTAAGDYVGTMQSALRLLLPPTTAPAVPSDAGPLEAPMPVSRLEASTTGVTLIARSRRQLAELEALASRSELTHIFIALVYGQVPEAWSHERVCIELPARMQRKKGYKKKQLAATAAAKASNCVKVNGQFDDEEHGELEEEEEEEAEEEEEEKEGQDVHADEQAGEGQSCGVAGSEEAAGNRVDDAPATTPGERLLPAEAVMASCLDRTPADCPVQLSTVRLECGGRRGRLSGDLCFLMRHLGHPIVGDRYARRERGALPRYFAALKGKTQLTCVGVQAMRPLFVFVVPVSPRLLASSWVSAEAAAKARTADREGLQMPASVATAASTTLPSTEPCTQDSAGNAPAPPKVVPAPPPPPPMPERRTPTQSTLRLRIGGPVVEKHLMAAVTAMGEGDRAALVPRSVSTCVGELVIFEAQAAEQSTASFARQHRILPQTDVTGLRLWPCSHTLLEFVVHEQMPKLQHRPLKVLELGAGVGLVSLAVASWLQQEHASNNESLSPSVVVMTDPAIPLGAGGGCSLDLLEAAAAANASVAAAATPRKLLWGDIADLARLRDEFGDHFDLVLGAELLYRDDSVEALVKTIDALGANTAILAQRTRPTGTTALEDHCIASMARHGYDGRTVDKGGECLVHVFERTRADPAPEH